MAYSRLMEVNNMVEHVDYGKGTYCNQPDVLRGEDRLARNKLKEQLEEAYTQEKEDYKAD